MKKFALWATALSAAVVLAIVGCNNPTSSDNTPAPEGPKGVLGNVAGVVYDNVTGLPIAGATVSLGKYQTTTDAGGSYIIEEIIPGEYTLTVSKDGFTAFSQEDIHVDADRYRVEDPYLEVAYLEEQIRLFENWLNIYSNVYSPTNPQDVYDQAGLGTGTWTYGGDGVYLNDDSSATITISETNEAGSTDFPKFEVVYNKLDYTYTYGIRVDLIKLTPLTGGFTGKIDVIFEVNSSPSVPLSGTVAAEGVEIYFIHNQTISSEGTLAETKYGPYKTGADGSFTANGLPANTEFDIVINPFSQKKGNLDYFFDPTFGAGGNIYRPGNWKDGVLSARFTTSTGNKQIPGETEDDPVTSEGYTDIGKFVIFTVGNVAYITSGNVPNAGAPFAVSGLTPGSITLTFNKAIRTGVFEAVLTLSDNALHATAGETQALQASWDGTTVTLTAGQILTGYSRISFPYAIDPALSIGTLDLAVGSVADDGSPIYGLEADTIKIYTETSLKSVKIEYIPAGSAPSRAAATADAQVGGAIKLTFNKPINVNDPSTSFIIIDGSNRVKADYRAGTENTEVYVFTDWKVDGSTLEYTVVAAGDTGDSFKDTITDLSVEAGGRLILTGTNLYTNAAGTPQAPSDTAIFPVDKAAIEFTFASIPADLGIADGNIFAELKDGDNPVATTAALSGNKVTITPAAPLAINTEYTLNLSIIKDGAVFYKNPSIPPPAAVVGPVYIDGSDIAFRTSTAYPYTARSTNLYTTYAGTVSTPSGTAYFPVNGAIEITFDKAIAAGVEAIAVLDGDTTYKGVIAGAKVTVTPVTPLTAGVHTLELNLVTEDGVLLYEFPAKTGGAGASGPFYYAGNVRIITFNAAYPYTALSTNLYTSYDGIVYEPAATAYFPADRPIEITFDKAIPAEVEARAVLDGVTYKGVIAGAKVTITPVTPLTTTPAPIAHTLELKLVTGDGVPLYVSPTAAGDHPFFISGTDVSFTALVPDQLRAKSTNLYTGVNGIPQPPTNDALFFPLDKTIEIVFDKEIPAGAKVIADLEVGTVSVYATAAVDAADRTKVTIDPAVTLTRGATYTLGLTIYTAANTVYYKNPIAAGEQGPLFIDGSELITFTASDKDERILVSTNLYIGLDGEVKTPANVATFPVDRTLEFTFDAAFPAGAVVTAVLTLDGTTTEIQAVAAVDATDRTKVTVNPVYVLTADMSYNLTLKIQNTAKTITYYTSPTGAGIVGFLFTDAEGILFKTEGQPQLTILGTNLYINPADGLPKDASTAWDDKFFAVDGNIVLTFKENISADDVEITAVLKDNVYYYNTYPVTASAAGKVITIDPTADLKPATIYYLQLKVVQKSGKKATLYAVPDTGTSLVSVTNPYTAVPYSDANYYIRFSTGQSKKAILESTNELYADNKPANYATYAFPVDGKFELTFDALPAGTTVADATWLSTANTGTPATPITSVVDVGAKKVTITPVDKLTASTTYYLRLVLTGPGGDDDEIYRPAKDGASGVIGPVYIYNNTTPLDSTDDLIQVRTTPVLAIVVPAGTSKTNIVSGNGGTNAAFDATSDIIIEFNQPITGITKAQLVYYDGAIVRNTTATATLANLSADRKVLTIKPQYLLAPSKEFYVRLNVTGGGQTLVHDPTNTGSLADYVTGSSVTANYATLKTPITHRLKGISKQPLVSGLTLVAAENVTGDPLPMPKTDTMVQLTLTPLNVSFVQSYVLFRAYQGVWDETAFGGPAVFNNIPAGDDTAVTGNGTSLNGLASHSNLEEIQYKVRGINEFGFVVESNEVTITFDP
jgi:methionine-rich copper-binding protein CopC